LITTQLFSITKQRKNGINIVVRVTVGVSTRHPDFLKFLFEMSEEFTALPTYAVIPLMKCQEGLLDVPGLNINPAMVRSRSRL
jgi:hypothetical protein